MDEQAVVAFGHEQVDLPGTFANAIELVEAKDRPTVGLDHAAENGTAGEWRMAWDKAVPFDSPENQALSDARLAG
jgi:hypothetical protein